MKFGMLTIERVFGTRSFAAKTAAIVAAAALMVQLALVFSFVVPRIGTLHFLRLHYTSAFGVDWIDLWWFLFAFPAAGFAVFFLNAAFAAAVSSKHPMLGSILAFATAFVEIALAIGGGLAVLLNS